MAGASQADLGLHIVFSTDCTAWSLWQSAVVVGSARRVGQRGLLTHLVVGCKPTGRPGEAIEDDDKPIGAGSAVRTHPPSKRMRRSLWMREAEQGVNVVFVPPCPGAEIMPWFNKPWAVAHWARSQPEGRIFALIDPDQFFLEALSLGRPQSQLLADAAWPNSMRAHLSDIPTPGVGIAQAYAIGGGWTRMQNVSRHCGGASRANCADLPSDHEANLHQSGGPPYLWVRDGTHGRPNPGAA